MFIIPNKKSTVLDSRQDITTLLSLHKGQLGRLTTIKKKKKISFNGQCLLAVVHVHHSLGSLHCPKPEHKMHNTINYTNKPEK